MKQMIKLGAKVTFIPEAFTRIENADIPVKITGRIVYINHEHRYFRVEAEVNGYALHECFKF